MATHRVSRRLLLRAVGTTIAAGAATRLTTIPSSAATIYTPKAGQDGAPFLTQYLSTAGTHALLTGEYTLDSAVVVPHNLRQLELGPTAKIMVRGNHSAFVRRGTVQLTEHLASAVGTDNSEFAALSGLTYKIGEYVLLSGANVIPGSSDKYGYLRKVTVVNGNVVGIDSRIPRAITTLPRTASAKLAPSLKIYGEGEIFNLDPTQGLTPLIDFFATDQPQVIGISVHGNGATGIRIAHCLNGLIDCRISDLLDDGQRYFGYGVLASGASRGLIVRGTISRVRHAVTTGPGPTLDSIGPVGEPEDCLFAPTAIDCTDKSIDTHRSGWNTTIIPTVIGGHGGVQIRADNTRVVGGSITGTWGPGVYVDAVVQVPAKITDLTVTNLNASGTAIMSQGPSVTTNIKIRNSYGTNIVLKNNCVVNGGSISAGNSTGVSFLGSNNSVNGIQLGDSITTPYIEAAGAVNNVFTTAPPTDIELLPAPTCTTAPVLSGTAMVGQQISSTYGVWNEGGIRLTWTFTRNGVAIASATDRTYPRYDITASDAGATLGVEVTANKVGFISGKASGGTTAPVALAGQLEATTAPSLTGIPSAGKYVTVNKGSWTPSAQTLQVAWLVDGIVVPGVTTNTFQVRTTDPGKKISARVTAVRAGWKSGVATTSALLMTK